MLNDEICKLREKLHESILKKNDYEVTYQLSVELDQLIAEYYRKNVDLNSKKKKKRLTNKKKSKSTERKLNKNKEKSISYSK